MKKTFSAITVLIIAFTAFTLTGCSKDKQTQLAGSEWDITSVGSPDGSYSLAVPVPLRLSFGKSGDVTLKLDVNSCMSTFTIQAPGKIKIETFGCTKMCCDNESSEVVRALLTEVTEYNISPGKLELRASGKIISLVRQDN